MSRRDDRFEAYCDCLNETMQGRLIRKEKWLLFCGDKPQDIDEADFWEWLREDWEDSYVQDEADNDD